RAGPRPGEPPLGGRRAAVVVTGRRSGRQLRLLGTAGVFTAPVLGPALLAAGMVPVKRRSAQARSALDGAARLLREGEAVALFPEGRIGATLTGLPEQLRTGAARLALSTGAPVVVVGVAGAEELVPLGTWRPALDRPRLDVRVSSPVDLAARLGLRRGTEPTEDDVRAATALLAELLEQQVRLAQGRPAALALAA
ncbi:MAG: 1-acyl-sn-glycerol-3-phosphate acyltransferase, partial [Actinomycetota bacterium]|nr:1-acyl-sn-glycerol-3-phosphate acyltransferase [Actinomycetota bacterium]